MNQNEIEETKNLFVPILLMFRDNQASLEASLENAVKIWQDFPKRKGDKTAEQSPMYLNSQGQWQVKEKGLVEKMSKLKIHKTLKGFTWLTLCRTISNEKVKPTKNNDLVTCKLCLRLLAQKQSKAENKGE